MSLGTGDYYGGEYTLEKLEKVYSFNLREKGTLKPNKAFYQKSANELGPSWAQRRDFVRYLIEDSNISPISKNYLKECEEWIPKY